MRGVFLTTKHTKGTKGRRKADDSLSSPLLYFFLSSLSCVSWLMHLHFLGALGVLGGAILIRHPHAPLPANAISFGTTLRSARARWLIAAFTSGPSCPNVW